MKVVLDTNILLISLSKKSSLRLILDKLLKGDYCLILTNEILSEYFEIIQNKTNFEIANNVIHALLLLPNVEFLNIY